MIIEQDNLLGMPVLKPKRLSSGDQIAIITPASPPFTDDVVDRAATMIRSWGYTPKLSKNVRKRTGFLAGTDKQRKEDLVSAFKDKKTKAILCVRGGYGTARLLNSIPWNILKSNPKILIGCSDITALHLSFMHRIKLLSFHGPMPQSLVQDTCPTFTSASLQRALKGGANSLGTICSGYDDKKTINVLRSGRASGSLIGGNLSMICSLLGTGFLPSFKGKILCLEEVSEAPYRIDRMLTQLHLSGILDQVSGIALGIFSECEYPPSNGPKKQTLQEVLKERLGSLKIPIVYGLPFGHIPNNATLPMGAKAVLDGKNGDLQIVEEFLI